MKVLCVYGRCLASMTVFAIQSRRIWLVYIKNQLSIWKQLFKNLLKSYPFALNTISLSSENLKYCNHKSFVYKIKVDSKPDPNFYFGFA